MLGKKIKKMIAVLAVAAMSTIAVAGCGTSSGSTSDAGSSQETEAGGASDTGNAQYEEMTIGVYSFDWTSSPYSEWKSYLEDYVGPHYNIEFVFSTESGDAEGEKTFMEKMGAVGAKGVLAISTYSLDNCLSIASQYQMYYLTTGMLNEDLSRFSEDQLAYYAGECGPGNASRINGGYELAGKTVELLNNDEKMTIRMVGLNPASGLPPVAPPLLQQQGVQNKIDELIAEGKDIDFEFVYLSGSAPEDWAEATDNAIASIGDTENSALICGSLDYSVQPILNAGIKDKIIVTGFQGVEEGVAPYFEDGTIDTDMEFGYSCTFPVVGFIQLYNAITGHPMMGDDGYPARVEITGGILVDSVEQYDDMLSHSYSISGDTYYTYDVIDQYLGITNPDVTVEGFTEFVNQKF